MSYIATERTGPVNGRIRSRVNSAIPRDGRLTVAIAAISHNYGRYLGQALRSAKSQSHKPDEIIVIDDSSTDNTREVAGNYDVPYFRIDAGHQYHGMAKALEVTTSDVLCFLDADDILPQDYVSSGLRCFDEHDVGVVYSDMKKFGCSNELIVFPNFSM